MAQLQTQPIKLYYWPTPNGWKISIMLEECGLPYDAHRISFEANEQFSPEFLALNPNARIPVMVDTAGPLGEQGLFESGAILWYLGRVSPDKSHKFG